MARVSKEHQLARKKALAQRLAYEAIGTGKVKRKPCEECGNNNAVSHHDDYDKPLDVRWLCRKHHAVHHASIGTYNAPKHKKRTPGMVKNASIHMRIQADLKEKLEALANMGNTNTWWDRSLSDFITKILGEYVDAAEKGITNN